MKVHLINPSHSSFGTAVITPRWMYVIAAATPAFFGDPILVDETLEHVYPEHIQPGDVVGISIHTENALRGYEIGKISRDRGAFVIFGGIHATLYPEEARSLGGAHAVVLGDGEIAWPTVLEDCRKCCSQINLSRRARRRRRISSLRVGILYTAKIYVGVGADRSWLSETLFLLFRLEDGWPASSPAVL